MCKIVTKVRSRELGARVTMGISFPSLSFRFGIYSSCFGDVPVASGLKVDLMECMFTVVVNGALLTGEDGSAVLRRGLEVGVKRVVEGLSG
jgi:hypothetical protein